MEEYNGFEYAGDVPTVYKDAPYEVFYEPLYMRRGEDRLFFAIKTDKGLEAIADGKDEKIRLMDSSNSQFHYNADNHRLCALIPEYKQ